MHLWHLTSDAPRSPRHPSAGEPVTLRLGTWPVEPGQEVRIEARVTPLDGAARSIAVDASWIENQDANSYWSATLDPFADGDRVEYEPFGGSARCGAFAFVVGPKIHLAILWHQHQPLYRDLARGGTRGAYRLPWVRLHALRDYYAMAARLESHPEARVTINLTPVLLRQIEDYAERGATDRALELTLSTALRLTEGRRREILETFFDADWHGQIFPWPRYRELLELRRGGARFSAQDLRDLQMWFNLAWFAPEFQEGEVRLPDGSTTSVRDLVEKGRDYSDAEIRRMVEEQRKILRNVVAIHRRLVLRGQLEVSTTPFYHPILPLVVDTDVASVDLPGAARPPRFQCPEDGAAQLDSAIAFHRERFGTAPSGMWPAEGAVGQPVVRLFTERGVRWIASDAGVLQRSGRFGYDTGLPDVLCRAYRAEDEAGRGIAVFFRDPELSDWIAFRGHEIADPEVAARSFAEQVKERFARRVDDPENRILSIILDGENAWGSYPQQGRGFLDALYRALSTDPEIRMVTFSEYLDGNQRRRILAHPLTSLAEVHDLFTGSWADETGSAPGRDLGTWIGEVEENRAWEMLRTTRESLAHAKITPETSPDAFASILAAEGSDWFWWFGEDQNSGRDAEFDDLFRMHLKNACRLSGLRPPGSLDENLVPHWVIWTFACPARAVQRGDWLVVRTHCPGFVEWRAAPNQPWKRVELSSTAGAVGGSGRHSAVLGPVPENSLQVEFRFHCTHVGCSGTDPCCQLGSERVPVVDIAP